MGATKSIDLRGGIGSCLETEEFWGLSEKLIRWRLNPDIRLMDTKRTKGRILGFVKGLRFSTQIAYLIRNIVSSEDVEVNWGHLIDENRNSCSPECDIIVHKKGHIQRWNGTEKPIMDFKFIESKNALAVISCKSQTKSIDKEYCKNFHKYNVKNILLFAECCRPKSIDRLKTQADDAGYKGFFHLYTLDKKDIIDRDDNVYLAFIQAIKNVSKPTQYKKTKKIK